MKSEKLVEVSQSIFVTNQRTIPQTNLLHLEKESRKTKAYRSIFLFFGTLFLLFGSLIYWYPLFGNFHLLSITRTFLKLSICSMCGLFSFCALYIAFTLREELETLKYIYNRASAKLKRCYHQKLLEEGYHFLPFLNPNYPLFLHYKNHYKEIKEKMHDAYRETIYLSSKLPCEQSLSCFEKTETLLSLVNDFNKRLDHSIDEFNANSLLKSSSFRSPE